VSRRKNVKPKRSSYYAKSNIKLAELWATRANETVKASFVDLI
jgi:hypothetical protein